MLQREDHRIQLLGPCHLGQRLVEHFLDARRTFLTEAEEDRTAGLVVLVVDEVALKSNNIFRSPLAT